MRSVMAARGTGAGGGGYGWCHGFGRYGRRGRGQRDWPRHLARRRNRRYPLVHHLLGTAHHGRRIHGHPQQAQMQCYGRHQRRLGQPGHAQSGTGKGIEHRDSAKPATAWCRAQHGPRGQRASPRSCKSQSSAASPGRIPGLPAPLRATVAPVRGRKHRLQSQRQFR